MTENLIPDPRVLELLTPGSVSPGLLTLLHDDAPTKVILGAGAGTYAVVFIEETEGIYLSPEDRSPENIVARWDEVTGGDSRTQFDFGGLQTQAFAVRAATAE
jgi:hypothetical protein